MVLAKKLITLKKLMSQSNSRLRVGLRWLLQTVRCSCCTQCYFHSEKNSISIL